jgi:ankyrin repeat protein
MEGDLDEVAEVFDDGARTDINQRDAEGNTPLICAVRNGHIPVVEFLLKRGADADLPNRVTPSLLNLII